LLAALYRPVWTTGIVGEVDFALAIVAFLPLFMWRTPPSLVVFLCAAAAAPRRGVGSGLLPWRSSQCSIAAVRRSVRGSPAPLRLSDQTGGRLLPPLGVWGAPVAWHRVVVSRRGLKPRTGGWPRAGG
jgi:hypothetical protein